MTSGGSVEARPLTGEQVGAGVVDPVAGRELEGPRRAEARAARDLRQEQPRDPDRLPVQLAERLLTGVVLEEPERDRGRDQPRKRDACGRRAVVESGVTETRLNSSADGQIRSRGFVRYENPEAPRFALAFTGEVAGVVLRGVPGRRHLVPAQTVTIEDASPSLRRNWRTWTSTVRVSPAKV